MANIAMADIDRKMYTIKNIVDVYYIVVYWSEVLHLKDKITKLYIMYKCA
jgi:hypothetical protein